MSARWAVALAAALGMMGGAALAADSADASAVRAVRSEWDAAYSAGDLKRLMDLYTLDAVSMAPGAPARLGRPAVQRDLAAFLASNKVRETAFVQDVVVSGDLAVERGRYRARIQPRRGKPRIEIGKHLVTYRRGRDGRWRVQWEIWNPDR